MSFSFPERAPARPTWLVTLADLALLLVGFFVLLQAHTTDGHAIAGAFREQFGRARFGGAGPVAPSPMPVAAAALDGFAPGSAMLPHAPDAVIAWTRDAVRDPRVTLTVTGGVDGSPVDVDPATASGAVLAADRARVLAAALAVVPTARGHVIIATATTPGRRAASVTIGFTGGFTGNQL